jgi:2-polyprenyl-6-methoxyphenol hydroxylase-like FAD-dependent oxidoreductase
VKEDALLAFYCVFVPSLTAEDQDYRTLIEASESGWWYSSPLPYNRRVVAYHTDDTNPTSRDARKRDGFMNLLHTTLHISRLITEGEYDILVETDTKYPICTAAGSSRLEPPCNTADPEGVRWVAVGDAAMAFDPLSSQGMITAMKTGCVVGSAIGQEILLPGSNDLSSGIREVYSQVWSKYVKEKRYFYSQGKRRFNGEFWNVRE